eukprot:8443229-Karenia_brevis.AAC.2
MSGQNQKSGTQQPVKTDAPQLRPTQFDIFKEGAKMQQAQHQQQQVMQPTEKVGMTAGQHSEIKVRKCREKHTHTLSQLLIAWNQDCLFPLALTCLDLPRPAANSLESSIAGSHLL